MADPNAPRYDIWNETGSGIMNRFGQAHTRREAVHVRQLASNKGKSRVWLYTDGVLDKIGIHKA